MARSLVEFVESVTDLTEWQRRLLQDVSSVSDLAAAHRDGTLRMAVSGRRYGKRLALALAVAAAVERGEHVHVAEPSGTTCANGLCDLPAQVAP